MALSSAKLSLIAGGATLAVAWVLQRLLSAKAAQRHAAVLVTPVQAQDETGAAVHVLTDPGSGVQMYARHWRPAARPRAVIIITHGLSWHSAYFKVVVQPWVEQQGFAVIAYDLPGYGLSGSVTGTRGYHPTALAGFADCLAHVLNVTQQTLHPGVPAFLLGESMGGAVTLFLLRQPAANAAIAGAITMAAAAAPPPHLLPSPAALWLMLRLGRLAPWLPMPGTAMTARDDYFASFGDQAVAQHAYYHDHLTLKRVPIGQICAMYPNMAELAAGIAHITAPLLIMHGDTDVRIPVDVSQQVHDAAVSTDKTIRVYKGGRHMLFLDTPDITRAVLGDIAAWVNARL